MFRSYWLLNSRRIQHTHNPFCGCSISLQRPHPPLSNDGTNTLCSPTSIHKWRDELVCPIKQIAVSRLHCLAITDQVVAFGELRHLLDGQRGSIFLPTLIPNMMSIRVKQVATATHHLVLAEDGTVYKQGGSAKRYLHKVEELDGIRIGYVAVGVGYRCLALSESGAVYSWGGQNSGVLGQGDAKHVVKPKKIERRIGTGAKFATMGSAATFIVDGAGKLYGCGKVPFEIAGRKTPCEVKVPTLIDSIPPSVRVVAIRAGEKHVFVALEHRMPSLLDVYLDDPAAGTLRPEDPKCPRLPSELEQQLVDLE